MGFSFLAVGAMFFLNLFSNMATGFAVFESGEEGASWFIAVGFLIVGIIVLFIQRKMASQVKEVKSKEFDGNIKEKKVPAIIEKKSKEEHYRQS